MAAQALYLKYRPRTFDEVVGQEPITRTLCNALRQGRIRHAYLLAGPRGTGKTTTARLLAKAVNCLADHDRPCNECAICQAINDGRLLDLIEIDAASNRGIDEIRDIREKVGFRPNQARYKVYVLDEAHMLTEPAFNALLKTLEEPPPHVIFTLVTTDPHKIPATITSRCQRFDFKRISIHAAVERLAYIAEQEGLHVEPAALELIARQTTGAMRDAISLLDQLASYGDDIALDQVQMVLGTLAGQTAAALVRSLVAGDMAGGLNLINQSVIDGADPRQLGREVVDYMRGLLLIKHGTGTRLLNATAEQAAEMEVLAAQLSTPHLLEAIRLFNGAVMDLRSGLQTIPQLPLEMALIQGAAEPPAASPAGRPPVTELPQAQPAGRPGSMVVTPAVGGGSPRPPSPTPAIQSEAKGTPAESFESASRAGPVVRESPAPVAAAPARGESALHPERSEGAEQPPPAAPPSQTPGGLTIAQVTAAWADVLRAVRQQNPFTQSVLNTGCKPVEVVGDEIVVTFPYAWLRDKLEDPQRRKEIQEAFDGVLGRRCRFRWVLEADFKPSASPPAAGLDDQAIDEISRWAAEHGGQTTVVQS